jgi:hypothetical protein
VTFLQFVLNVLSSLLVNFIYTQWSIRCPGAMTLDVAAKIPAILLISVLSALTELVPGGERLLSITAPCNFCRCSYCSASVH